MSVPLLSQTITLLDRDESADSTYGGYVSFNGESWSDGLSVGVLWLDRESWDDMGSPAQITVTVVPGDALNGD